VFERFAQDLRDVVLCAMSCWCVSVSLPIFSDGWPPSVVTCSPAIAAWFIPSVAWSRIHLMIGMRACPNTIRE
jgi:hypothetical protein